jgi:WbqC-like protein family
MNAIDFVSDLFYLPSVDWYAHALHYKKIFVPHASYNKKFHLNRTNIVGANGLHSLSIPLQGGRNQRVSDIYITISEAEDWRKLHLRSIQTMYGNAPFFENVFPYLIAFYQQKFASLYDCNLQTLLLINKILKIEIAVVPIIAYPNYKEISLPPIQYNQVFMDKNMFIPHASVLDLLMNEGKNAISILNKMIDSKLHFEK